MEPYRSLSHSRQQLSDWGLPTYAEVYPRLFPFPAISSIQFQYKYLHVSVYLTDTQCSQYAWGVKNENSKKHQDRRIKNKKT